MKTTSSDYCKIIMASLICLCSPLRLKTPCIPYQTDIRESFTFKYEKWRVVVLRSGPDALLRTPSPALTQRALYAHWIFDSSVPRHDVKRQKTALFYRKRLCVIHFGLLRGPVCFSSGRRNDQFIHGFGVGFLDFLSPFLCRCTVALSKDFWLQDSLENRRYLRTFLSGINQKKGDDGCFIVTVRVVYVDKFSVSIAGNRVCLSLSRHHCPAAAHQVGTERQHWTARYRVPYSTQVSTYRLEMAPFHCKIESWFITGEYWWLIYHVIDIDYIWFLSCAMNTKRVNRVINFCFRNWCQYTVSRTVSCQVHNGTETTVQRVFQGCRWPGPCSKVIRYPQLSLFSVLFLLSALSVSVMLRLFCCSGSVMGPRVDLVIWGPQGLCRVLFFISFLSMKMLV